MLQARIMFTGLVTNLGEIRQIRKNGRECRFIIYPLNKLANLQDGESIAIDGVCLSVETHTPTLFGVYASHETLSRTNLGAMRPGWKVNMERALEIGQRLDGHIVSGHIDCTARLIAKESAGSSVKMRLQYPEKFAPQVITKGSVALNGISLTINASGKDWLEINIIPDTQKRTNLPLWEIGSNINMETDIIGKYVEHMLAPWKGANDKTGTFTLLAKNGFI